MSEASSAIWSAVLTSTTAVSVGSRTVRASSGIIPSIYLTSGGAR